MVAAKRIPYGLADYGRLRRDNSYYVDKTRFIPLIEAAPYFLFFIRPRRFGKSLWLSILEHYYDIGYQDQFEHLFAETYIGQHPTPEKNSYLVLVLNFSAINPQTDKVQQSFEAYGQQMISHFVERYDQFFSQAEQAKILNQPTLGNQLRQIFIHTAAKNLKVYMLVDEYDNFANTILTTAGEQAYRDLTHGAGFFRYFFNVLKSATSGQGSGLTRLFITGVSPLTMDDVTSGFNIGRNISLDPQFNELLGLTQSEVKAMLTHYYEAGFLSRPAAGYWSVMQQWYDHYRFSDEVETSLFNTDMVLYFVGEAGKRTTLPKNLIDDNIRIDYNKLRHLILVNQQLNGNFNSLKQIIERGQVVSAINTSFPLERLLDRENFISLLFYFGLLSIDGSYEDQPILRIPNLTVKQLMYGYLRQAYQEVDIFRLDLWRFAGLVGGMAYRGTWATMFDFLSAQIKSQTSVRDYLNGEKVIQGFLVAYLNISTHFLTWSEKEMGGGFVDIYLEPFLARYPAMKYGYLLELKYISRQAYSQAKLDQKVTKAQTQLQKYLKDPRLAEVATQVSLIGLVLVYNGWELVYCQTVTEV